MSAAALPLIDHVYRVALPNGQDAEVLVLKANYVVVTYLPRRADGTFSLSDPTFAYPTAAWGSREPKLLGPVAEGDYA